MRPRILVRVPDVHVRVAAQRRPTGDRRDLHARGSRPRPRDRVPRHRAERATARARRDSNALTPPTLPGDPSPTPTPPAATPPEGRPSRAHAGAAAAPRHGPHGQRGRRARHRHGPSPATAARATRRRDADPDRLGDRTRAGAVRLEIARRRRPDRDRRLLRRAVPHHAVDGCQARHPARARRAARRARRPSRSIAAARKKKRRLWGDATGNFRTRGRYGSAVNTGTKWMVEDRCDGTLFRVDARDDRRPQERLRDRAVRVKPDRRPDRAAVLRTLGLIAVAVAVLARRGAARCGSASARGLELETVDARFRIRGPVAPPADVVLVWVDERTLSELRTALAVPARAAGAADRRAGGGPAARDRDRPPVHRADRRSTTTTR